MKGYLKATVLLIVLVLLVTFGVQNRQPVSVSYFFGIGSPAIPLYGLLYLSVFVGVLIGLLAAVPGRLRLRKAVKFLQSENQGLKERLRSPAEPGFAGFEGASTREG